MNFSCVVLILSSGQVKTSPRPCAPSPPLVRQACTTVKCSLPFIYYLVLEKSRRRGGGRGWSVEIISRLVFWEGRESILYLGTLYPGQEEGGEGD